MVLIVACGLCLVVAVCSGAPGKHERVAGCNGTGDRNEVGDVYGQEGKVEGTGGCVGFAAKGSRLLLKRGFGEVC